MTRKDRPNIIFIFTDQQSATMMGCTGNPYVRTPAMDSLAATGVRFERAYCANPMCGPSRFSLMTGRMPGEIGLRNNNAGHLNTLPDCLKQEGVGWLLRRAGYEVAYGGKFYPAQPGPDQAGFESLTRDARDELAEAGAKFIRQRRETPFFLVASFINPHDICYMAIRDFAQTDEDRHILRRGAVELATLDEALRLPAEVSPSDFFAHHCPPVPANFEPQADEPEAISLMQARRPFKAQARRDYTVEQWRLHRWAYARLTEMVDVQIGRLLDALHQSGQAENTVIIFSSDHGDMDAAHRMEHKTAFYEEACRIPLIISWPGVTPAGGVNETHLVSNGLDLAPTLCDYAGLEIPKRLAGLSLRPLAEGKSLATWRQSLPVESEIGRMIVTERYKYMLYDEGENREQLIDRLKDPGEMRNAAGDPANEAILLEHRELFAEIFGDWRLEIGD